MSISNEILKTAYDQSAPGSQFKKQLNTFVAHVMATKTKMQPQNKIAVQVFDV